MEEDVLAVRLFWEKVPFFGDPIEQFLFRHWYALLLLPYLLPVAFGLWLHEGKTFVGSATYYFHDPYVDTLGVALVLIGIAFDCWQSTMRMTFSTAVESGIVSSTPAGIQAFLAESRKFKAQIRKSSRFAPIAVAVIGALLVNGGPHFYLYYLRFIPSTFRHTGSPHDWKLPAALCNLEINVFLLVVAYAGGAVAWSLLCAARWIGRISSRDMLRTQPGHPDGCCGLEGIGNCCLQSVVPLVIGMILLLIWGNGSFLPIFRESRSLPQAWIVTYSYAMMAMVFVLACTLVFLPVRALHHHLESFKRAREREFFGALEKELASIHGALFAGDDNHVRIVSDRLKLAQALDPRNLMATTWPFDRDSLVRYALTPILSLLAPLGTAVLHHAIELIKR